MVKGLSKGRGINSSTCRPCGCIKISSWQQKDRVQNPRGLMRLDGCVSPFDGVLFGVSWSPTFSLSLWLFDFVILLSMNKYGGAKNIGPRHLLNLSKIYQFVDEFRKPHSGDVWVSLLRLMNTKNVNASSAIPLLIFFLCTWFIKLLFNSRDNACVGDNQNDSLR